MSAFLGAATGVSAVGTILDDLVTAFKSVFNNIYNFVRPGWVIAFTAGAPIALKMIDNGITVALNTVADWAASFFAIAGNVYNSVYNWVCGQLGGCGGLNVFQSVAATIAAGLASASIWLAAVVMQYIVQPLAGFILNALKQVFSAIYQFACAVLVPIVRVSIMAYVDYHAVKHVYRHARDMMASWFSSLSPKDMLRAIGKTVATFAAPLASGFIASHMYDYILQLTGACGLTTPIVMPGAPAVPTVPATTGSTVAFTVAESLSAEVLPSGEASTLSQFAIPTAESIAATLKAGLSFRWPVDVAEFLAAAVRPVPTYRYTVDVVESIVATLVAGLASIHHIDVAEDLAARVFVVWSTGTNVAAKSTERYGNRALGGVNVTTSEQYSR